ncbi:hypothetical protein DFH07DRAFT_956117 [Mycena maculata]|uniref:Uncharacterized protein n=1 Tax=Mycena maculata TaxID=230809 RepID=A0AAD7JG79_9AGAR|nr:hypothetical protein DFH07DRAFT_956117 [Mycena maculata]
MRAGAFGTTGRERKRPGVGEQSRKGAPNEWEVHHSLRQNPGTGPAGAGGVLQWSGSNCVSALLVLIAALVVAALLVAWRIVRAPVPAGQPFRYHRARAGLHLIFTTPPTLTQIGTLPPHARLAAFVEFPGRFAREGYGAVYVTAVVEDYFLGLLYSGQMNAAEFLGHMRVKVGHTTDLPSRRKGYSKCNVAQTHLWLFCFHPRQRMATERMCHICFDMKDTRAYLVCSCNVEHQEYWWLQNIGGFGEVEARIRRVLDALGESDAPRWVAISCANSPVAIAAAVEAAVAGPRGGGLLAAITAAVGAAVGPAVTAALVPVIQRLDAMDVKLNKTLAFTAVAHNRNGTMPLANLPPLANIDDIRNLSDADARAYYRGYGGTAGNHLAMAGKREFVRVAIGCTVDL